MDPIFFVPQPIHVIVDWNVKKLQKVNKKRWIDKGLQRFQKPKKGWSSTLLQLQLTRKELELYYSKTSFRFKIYKRFRIRFYFWYFFYPLWLLKMHLSSNFFLNVRISLNNFSNTNQGGSWCILVSFGRRYKKE